MGEYADMVIDGDVCECCGEYMGQGDGYARTCKACKREEREEKKRVQQEQKDAKKVK